LKILLLTQWFDPEPTFKGLLFAKQLQKEGCDVEVITGFPNYPGGKVYEGYKVKFYQKEVIDGITVHRVPLYPNHDASALKRVVNYVSFFLSSMLYGVFKRKRPDIIYVYHPPLTSALSASVISFFRRVPFVVDIQDLWPDTLSATGMINNKKALSIVEWFCQFVYKRAKHIVVLSPGFKNRLIERGVNKDKIDVIYNWCDEGVLENGDESALKLPASGFNLVFAGNLGHAQGVPALIDMANELKKRELNANLVFVGSGLAVDDAKSKVKALSLQNVFFLPRVPMSEVGSVLQAADALLVHLIKDELFEITIPSRTQAYLSVGRPIVMAVEGDASSLISKAKAGVICEPECVQSLADGVETLLKMSKEELEETGHRGRRFYEDNLCLAKGVDKFIEVFRKIKND